MEENKKSYYAIIPANVRYDEDLSANAKLLYGEITALCNEKGYCWATNDYFAKLYKVAKQTISRWIRELKENNYINIQMIYKEGSNEIVNRYIQICEYPINKNVNTPINKNVKENNTYINNTYNIATAEITKCFQDNIGLITPTSAELLFSYLDDFKDYQIIIEAIKKSALANKRSTNYINGILKSWKNKGYKVLKDLDNETKQKESTFESRAYKENELDKFYA